MDYETKYEALAWLKNNNNPSAFASNRFDDTSNAINFVEELYKLGAVKVSIIGVWDEPERIQEEGGSYAETLFVELPKDTENRDKILDVYNKEIEEYGLNDDDEYVSDDENILIFWWD